MSRIRGLEAKVLKVKKDVLQNDSIDGKESNKKKDDLTLYKGDVERQQINELLYKLPQLDKIFDVHRKIGEGTFSSVYLGSLRQHSQLPDAEKRWFAIKHLVPTAHPARIEHELRCLQDIGGKNNVIGVELCLRHLDTVVFVMPYIPHRKFSEYVGEMDAAELRRYMRALLAALRHVHSFGVIHRDVKPSNFLYDRERGRYLLVDFGLAQRMCPPPPAAAPALPAAPPPAHANTHKRPREEEEDGPAAKRMALDLSVGPRRRPAPSALPSTPAPPASSPLLSKGEVPSVGAVGAVGAVGCRCAGVGGVCGACSRLAAARAARAGTQGFRPPEVLLKCARQTTAVDVWASGVVLASVLAARYPLLRAPDDGAALAELADLLGTPALRRAAAALGRRIVVSSFRRGLSLRKLAAHLRAPPAPAPPAGPPAPPCAHCRLPAPRCICLEDTPQWQIVSGRVVCGFPDAAFALCARLLEPDPRARLSAAEALEHPFLAEP